MPKLLMGFTRKDPIVTFDWKPSKARGQERKVKILFKDQLVGETEGGILELPGLLSYSLQDGSHLRITSKGFGPFRSIKAYLNDNELKICSTDSEMAARGRLLIFAVFAILNLMFPGISGDGLIFPALFAIYAVGLAVLAMKYLRVYPAAMWLGLLAFLVYMFFDLLQGHNLIVFLWRWFVIYYLVLAIAAQRKSTNVAQSASK